MQCNPESNTGCDRCRLSTPTICCDLHDPPAFAQFANLDIESQPRKKQKAAVKTYTPTPLDIQLKIRLHEWRVTSAKQDHSRAEYTMFRYALVMSDEVRQRIVDCAHDGLLGSVEDLKHEVSGWTSEHIQKYSKDVLDIVQTVRLKYHIRWVIH
jgi:hypothetical protein